jgi:ubiquinone/menaquinone biosynthesis C-methylase UbiE
MQDPEDVKQGIRRNFARRARSYDRHAGMQRLMAQRLMGIAGGSVARARRILEIGCGTGYLTGLLRQANGEARLGLRSGAASAAARGAWGGGWSGWRRTGRL